MISGRPKRAFLAAILAGAGALPVYLSAQATQSATKDLLEKAHALEIRGRMDMASQTWQQVLLAEPNNTEALAGLARAAKMSGNNALASSYLERLRAANPNDPNIARIETMGSQANQTAQLQQAGKLAQAGQYTQAMAIYRSIFGQNPPPGDWSLAYYETEAAILEDRPHAIAGFRALMEKYPNDSRYQVALGRILTYNPQTRSEGRRLLEKHPNDPQAVAALRQSLVWDKTNPAATADIRAFLAKRNDPELAEALRKMPKEAPPPDSGAARRCLGGTCPQSGGGRSLRCSECEAAIRSRPSLQGDSGKGTGESPSSGWSWLHPHAAKQLRWGNQLPRAGQAIWCSRRRPRQCA